jgi:hypothetical protein
LSAGPKEIHPDARVLQHIIDSSSVSGAGGGLSGDAAAGGEGGPGGKPWSSAKRMVRQTMDWSQIGPGAAAAAANGEPGGGIGGMVARSLKLPSKTAASTNSGAAVPGTAPVPASSARLTGLSMSSMFAGGLAAVTEGAGGDGGGAGAEVREQRAGSVGVILSQKDLAMSSAAQHEETLKAWRNM